MKELFYQGTSLEEDFEMIGYLKEIQNSPEALILETPEACLVHEMEYVNNYNSDRRDTGRTHVGYYSHYFTFFYRGYIVGVSSGMSYPFTDVNSPGRYNFVLYERRDLCYKRQLTYSIAYEGLHSVDKWLDDKRRRSDIICKRDRVKLPFQCIHTGISSNTRRKVENAVWKHGGYREKKVLKESPFLLRTETWNDAHKVVHVISAIKDADGHRDGFDCDVATGRICG